MSDPLRPGATIGILGAGQLGRMLALAAARMGFRVHIFAPDATAAPAAAVAGTVTASDWADTPALRAFAEDCDVVTYEFENVPASAVRDIAEITPVHPDVTALETAQDRVAEKEFFTELDMPVAPYAAVNDAGAFAAELVAHGTPSILKTRRMGYDGKGQVRIESADEAGAAGRLLDHGPCILEDRVDFSAEISVVAARGVNGDVALYEPGQNRHVDGILHETLVPARVDHALPVQAMTYARVALTRLDYVGVLALEMFVTPDGLILNEMAPRVHNSGHWTLDACVTDQFTQHIRAIAGWPLGDPRRTGDARMINLLGADVDDLGAYIERKDAAIHVYGKDEAREGRKMGHVTFVHRATLR